MVVNNNPVALITGAAQRIGEQLVRALHARNYNVIIHYRSSATNAERIAAELNAQRGDSACALPAAMEDMAAVQRLADQTLARWGHLNVLINNASGYHATPWGQATPQDWDALFGSNLKGPFFLTQALLPA
jgi:pteridine reductase